MQAEATANPSYGDRPLEMHPQKAPPSKMGAPIDWPAGRSADVRITPPRDPGEVPEIAMATAPPMRTARDLTSSTSFAQRRAASRASDDARDCLLALAVAKRSGFRRGGAHLTDDVACDGRAPAVTLVASVAWVLPLTLRLRC